MSNTVNEAFANFNRDYVNLSPERTTAARASRTWLLEQIDLLPGKVADFPQMYSQRHIHFGSFSRKTKIRPLDDVDLIAAIYAGGATYETVIHGKEYALRPPVNSTYLSSVCNDDGTINSIKVVNLFVKGLGEVDQYKKAEIHRKQEAVTLQLNSYEWNFDIVPAFFTDVDHYLIPDGSGGWKATDPRVDQERLSNLEALHGDKILQVIRTTKFWNARAMMTTIPSYLLENMIMGYFENKGTMHLCVDVNFRDFLIYLVNGIHFEVSDPKDYQGDLNTLTSEERQGISKKAQETLDKANAAMVLEVTDQNQPAAIRKWAEIFGDNFN